MAAAHTNPTLRIKLVKSAKTAEEGEPNNPLDVEKTKKYIQKLLERAEADLDLKMEAMKEVNLNMAAPLTNPTLRIKLVKSAKTANENEPSDPGEVERVNNYLRKLFEEDDLNLETEATEEARERNRKRLMELCQKMEATEMNKKRLMELFKKMEKKVEDQRRLALEQFKSLSCKPAPPYVPSFWDAVGSFIKDIFE